VCLSDKLSGGNYDDGAEFRVEPWAKILNDGKDICQSLAATSRGTDTNIIRWQMGQIGVRKEKRKQSSLNGKGSGIASSFEMRQSLFGQGKVAKRPCGGLGNEGWVGEPLR